MKLRQSMATLALITACLPLLQGCFTAAVVGTGATVLMITDRRSSGSYVEDEGVEIKAINRISERFGDAVHINVTSYNRNVLLTGEAPNPATRDEIVRIVSGVENVRGIVNEIRTEGISTLGARSNDTYLTGKVKARLLDANTVPANLIKVVTESGTVYLLGMVTQQEGNKAAEVASTTGGVKRVVRVFEYISPQKANELDQNRRNNKQNPITAPVEPGGNGR